MVCGLKKPAVIRIEVSYFSSNNKCWAEILEFKKTLYFLYLVCQSIEDGSNRFYFEVDRKLVEDPPPPPPSSNFIAGRPKAALLFWFFSGLRCGVWLCFLILVSYENRKQVKIRV